MRVEKEAMGVKLAKAVKGARLAKTRSRITSLPAMGMPRWARQGCQDIALQNLGISVCRAKVAPPGAQPKDWQELYLTNSSKSWSVTEYEK
ncbi:hypothetical protein FJ414_23010 [Mesorhizobium sp. B3-1-6]|nr:hypothetical protein FJ414_23010 [Mesorhizobium sp. B3-1-6]